MVLGIHIQPTLKYFVSVKMPKYGHDAICEKCMIWYHPKWLGLGESDIPAEDVPWFCK